MRIFLPAAASALLALAVPATADEKYDACVEKGMTNADYQDCGSAWIERADAELNVAWRALRAIASEQSAKLLLDEQRAWNAYKEKACAFWASGEYGTIGSALAYMPCLARVIEARTAELRVYQAAMEEH